MGASALASRGRNTSQNQNTSFDQTSTPNFSPEQANAQRALFQFLMPFLSQGLPGRNPMTSQMMSFLSNMFGGAPRTGQSLTPGGQRETGFGQLAPPGQTLNPPDVPGGGGGGLSGGVAPPMFMPLQPSGGPSGGDSSSGGWTGGGGNFSGLPSGTSLDGGGWGGGTSGFGGGGGSTPSTSLADLMGPGFRPFMGAMNSAGGQFLPEFLNVFRNMQGLQDQGNSRINRALDLGDQGIDFAQWTHRNMANWWPWFQNFADQGAGGMNPFMAALQNAAGGGSNPLLGQVSDSMMPMLQTGMPIDQMPAFRAMQDVMKRDLGDQIATQANALGGAGRFSSAAIESSERLRQRGTQDQNALLANMTQQGQEAARNRQIHTGGLLSGQGQFLSQLPLQAAGTGGELALGQGAQRLRAGEFGSILPAQAASTAQGFLRDQQGNLLNAAGMPMNLAQMPLNALSSAFPFLNFLGNMGLGAGGLGLQGGQLDLSRMLGMANLALGAGGLGQAQQAQDINTFMQLISMLFGGAFGSPLGGQRTTGTEQTTARGRA